MIRSFSYSVINVKTTVEIFVYPVSEASMLKNLPHSE